MKLHNKYDKKLCFKSCRRIRFDRATIVGRFISHFSVSKSIRCNSMAGNKDTCVLELDDIDDADIVDSLMDSLPPAGYQV